MAAGGLAAAVSGRRITRGPVKKMRPA